MDHVGDDGGEMVGGCRVLMRQELWVMVGRLRGEGGDAVPCAQPHAGYIQNSSASQNAQSISNTRLLKIHTKAVKPYCTLHTTQGGEKAGNQNSYPIPSAL